ncbi:MAG: MCP four helix bundle domain-containing protein, partial [Deltaproteobacteria bacterium]|nr:MCP four helix bundle domain-containing protein [Deltaproteobacteria bacterium]
MFANMSLKSRLWVLGLVSVLGIATIALSSIWHAYNSKEMLLDFIDNTVAINHSSTTSYANGLQMGQALRNILLDPANKKAYDNFAAANKEFGAEIDKMALLLAKVNGGNAVAATLKGKIEQWHPLQQQIIDHIKGGHNTEALALLVNKETPAWRTLRTDLLDIVKRSEVDAEQARVKLLNSLDTTRTLAIVLSLVSFFLVVTIALFVSRGIFHQVGGEPAYAAEKLQQIAEGDLTHPVVVSHGDTKSIVAAMSSM